MSIRRIQRTELRELRRDSAEVSLETFGDKVLVEPSSYVSHEGERN